MESTQFQQIAERDRPRVRLVIDGRSCEALAGDTLLTALLTNGRRLRLSEFGDGPRAGFCLMGACQGCWVALEDGTRLRACTSFVADGMRIVTRGNIDMSAPGRPKRELLPLGGKARSAKGALGMESSPPVVVGAGPAGVRAAATLAAAGLAPIVLDEAPASGGQIYRRAPAGFTRPYRTLYGFDAGEGAPAARGVRRHQEQRRLPADTLVWDLEARRAALPLRRAKQGGSVSRPRPDARRARPDHSVSGLDASRHLHAGWRADRVEAPGLRHRPSHRLHGHRAAALSRRLPIRQGGWRVAAVLDTSPFAAKRRAVPGLLRGGSTFAKGLWYVAALRARGIVMASGIRPIRAEQTMARWRHSCIGTRGRERRLAAMPSPSVSA